MTTESHLRAELEARDRRIADLEAIVVEMRSELRRAFERIEQLERERARLREENAELRRENAALKRENAALKRENAELRRRLDQDSTNSHRPPSTDSPRSKKKRRRKKKASSRRPGKQPGAPGEHRQRLEPDKIVALVPEACRECGHHLDGRDPDPQVHQTVDLPPVVPVVVDYHMHRLKCPACGSATRASLPAELGGKTYGPGISALASTMAGKFRLSRRMCQDFLHTVCSVDVSLGTVSNHESGVADALEEPHRQVIEAVSTRDVLYCDETGWPIDNGQTGWLWTAVADDLVGYHIDPTRSAAALEALVGDFGGIICSDRHPSYSTRPVDTRQLCWAHLVRNFAAIAALPGRVGDIGAACEDVIWLGLTLNRWIEDGRIGLGREVLDELVDEALRPHLRWLCQQGTKLEEAPGIFQNLLDSEAALWTWRNKPDVEMTNNRAERALRFGVIWRKISFGSISEQGQRFVERMLTVGRTLKLAGRNMLDFIYDSLTAHRLGLPPPSLLPT